MPFYVARVKIASDTPKSVKCATESYLVDAVSVTHAEAKVNEDFKNDGVEFEVNGVTQSRICKVI